MKHPDHPQELILADYVFLGLGFLAFLVVAVLIRSGMNSMGEQSILATKDGLWTIFSSFPVMVFLYGCSFFLFQDPQERLWNTQAMGAKSWILAFGLIACGSIFAASFLFSLYHQIVYRWMAPADDRREALRIRTRKSAQSGDATKKTDMIEELEKRLNSDAWNAGPERIAEIMNEIFEKHEPDSDELIWEYVASHIPIRKKMDSNRLLKDIEDYYNS